LTNGDKLQDNDGFTSAHWAVMFGGEGVVELLRARDADFTIENRERRTPRDIA
jgi:ankyrin repeat protein